MKFRNGIIISMILFVVFIVTLGILMQKAGTDLVSDDYYLKDRAYQYDINAKKNAQRFKSPLKLSAVINEMILVEIPDSLLPIKLKLYFMRPNDKRLDKKLTLHFTKQNKYLLQKGFLNKGHYDVKASYVFHTDSCIQNFPIEIK
jgi:hypothetical protein